MNVEFSYELGVEKLPTHTNRNQVEWPLMLHRAYFIYMAGGYAAYYYNNTASTVVWVIGTQEMCVFLGFSDSIYQVAGGATPLSAHASSMSMNRSIAFARSRFRIWPRHPSLSPPAWLRPRTSYMR